MQNKKEIWKDIKGYEGLYQVSSFGRVKSFLCNKEKFLRGSANGMGYLTTQLKGKTKAFHRLVAEAFLGKSDLNVNHKDGNKTNNNIENLEYITQRDNVIHGHKSKKEVSKYTGVTWNKNMSRWVSKIFLNKKTKHLGFFHTELEAYNAYLKALEENEIKSKYA